MGGSSLLRCGSVRRTINLGPFTVELLLERRLRPPCASTHDRPSRSAEATLQQQRSGSRRCSPALASARPAERSLRGDRVPPTPIEEAVIVTAPKPASWTWSEEYVAEDTVLANARSRAEEVGVAPIGPGGGAALRFLASVLDARAVVEIGTGTGVSGLWLLRGMRPDGVLTSVDTEAEHQRLAKETFTEAGIASQRARLIPGAALEVLPRLTDGHYDIVFADGDKQEYPEYLTEALRLLRPGGVVVFDNALWHDRVADPAQRDPDTIAIRELARTVVEHEQLVPVLLPVGDGLLMAKKVWVPEP